MCFLRLFYWLRFTLTVGTHQSCRDMPCLWQNVGTCLWHVEPAGRAVRAGRHRKAMSLHGINPVGPLGWLTSEGAMSLRQSIYVVIGLLYKMVLIPKWFNSLCIMHSTLCITFNRPAKLLHFFHTPALPAVKKSKQPDAKAFGQPLILFIGSIVVALCH